MPWDKGFKSAVGIRCNFPVTKGSCLISTIGCNYEKSKFDGMDATYWGDYLSRKSILLGIGMKF